MAKRIAVVEDEQELRDLLEYNLRREGYEMCMLDGSRNTIEYLERFSPDLIVLDVMLPETDGFQLCRQIRNSPALGPTPIVFLTARSDEVDRVLGLELGADDYMTKPFSPRELMARLKARLRRTAMDAVPRAFRVDHAGRRIYLHDRELVLTATEYSLLEYFLAHRGSVYSRDQLRRAVWGENHYITPRAIDVHVRKLREMIEEQPDNPHHLVTVRGFGYRFES